MFTRKMMRGAVALAAGLLLAAATTGCDDGTNDAGWGGGGYGDSYVEPMDFSPYGYDYDMYDLFTEDI